MAKSKKNKKAPLRNYTPTEIVENPSNKAIIRFNNDLSIMIDAGEDGSSPQGSTQYKGDVTSWNAGGGDSAPTPVITYKLIIKDSYTDTFSSVGSNSLRLIVNGIYKEPHIEDIGITAGNEYEWLIPVFEDSYDSGKWYFTCPVYSDNDYIYGTPSDIVNLTPADNHPYYTVTDPTQNGSITVTFE